MMCPHYCVAARSPYVSVVTFRDVEVFLNYNDMVRTRLSVVDADTVYVALDPLPPSSQTLQSSCT